MCISKVFRGKYFVFIRVKSCLADEGAERAEEGGARETELLRAQVRVLSPHSLGEGGFEVLRCVGDSHTPAGKNCRFYGPWVVTLN